MQAQFGEEFDRRDIETTVRTLKAITQQGVIGADLPEAGAPVFDSALQIKTPERGRALAEALGPPWNCIAVFGK